MTRTETFIALMVLAPATIIAVVALVRGYDILLIHRPRPRHRRDEED